MEVSFKETVGLYILFKNSGADLPATLNRLRARIEKILNEKLTLSQLQNIEDFFNTLDD